MVSKSWAPEHSGLIAADKSLGENISIDPVCVCHLDTGYAIHKAGSTTHPHMNWSLADLTRSRNFVEGAKPGGLHPGNIPIKSLKLSTNSHGPATLSSAIGNQTIPGALSRFVKYTPYRVNWVFALTPAGLTNATLAISQFLKLQKGNDEGPFVFVMSMATRWVDSAPPELVRSLPNAITANQLSKYVESIAKEKRKLREVIRKLVKAGHIFVAAGGQTTDYTPKIEIGPIEVGPIEIGPIVIDPIDLAPYNRFFRLGFPARMKEVIAAGAHDRANKTWGAGFYSLKFNGSSLDGKGIDVCAPGVKVTLSRVSHDDNKNDASFDIEHSSGTSYATQYIGGAAALWIAKHGKKEIKEYYKSDLNNVTNAFRYALAKSQGSLGGDSAKYVKYKRLQADKLLEATGSGPGGLPTIAELKPYKFQKLP